MKDNIKVYIKSRSIAYRIQLYQEFEDNPLSDVGMCCVCHVCRHAPRVSHLHIDSFTYFG